MLSPIFARRVTAAAAACAALCSGTAAQAYDSLFVFGDSLSDSGNNYFSAAFVGTTPVVPNATFVPSLPYTPSAGFTNPPDYSNGPVWVPAFAAGLGLAAYGLPSLVGGGDYAYGGARIVANGSSPSPPYPTGFPFSLQTQLSTYLGSKTVSANALYVIAGGGNDVRDTAAAVAGGAPLAATVAADASAFATAAATMVGTLKAAGAKNIVVWNTPDVGKTPAAGSGVGVNAAGASFIAAAFNSALSLALAGTGATIFDTYSLIDSIVANPVSANWNFSNVTLACGYAANNCNPASALFWDGIHPTAYAHSVLAQQMLAVVAVPEPAPAALLPAGLAVLALRRRSAQRA